MKNETLNTESDATGEKIACLCGFSSGAAATDCPNCELRAALDLFRKVKAGESVTVLFTGVSASPARIGGNWYWTIDKNFGDTEYDGGALSVSVTGRKLEELLNLGDMNAEETILKLDRFDRGLEMEEF